MRPIESLCSMAVNILRSGNPIDFPKHRPVYVLRVSQFPAYGAKNLTPGEWTAHAGADLDLRLQPILRGLGQWQGRGFAMVLDDTGAELCHVNGLEQLPTILGIVVHEAGHYLESESCPVREGPAAVRRNSTPTMQRYHGTDHGLRFVRSTLHLWNRCQSALPFDVDHCRCAGDRYRMSPVRDYVNALGSELITRRGESIVGILKSQPPSAAMDLFESDLSRRRGSHVA